MLIGKKNSEPSATTSLSMVRLVGLRRFRAWVSTRDRHPCKESGDIVCSAVCAALSTFLLLELFCLSAFAIALSVRMVSPSLSHAFLLSLLPSPLPLSNVTRVPLSHRSQLRQEI